MNESSGQNCMPDAKKNAELSIVVTCLQHTLMNDRQTFKIAEIVASFQRLQPEKTRTSQAVAEIAANPVSLKKPWSRQSLADWSDFTVCVYMEIFWSACKDKQSLRLNGQRKGGDTH